MEHLAASPVQLALAPLSEAGAIRNTVPTATPEAEAPPAGVPDSAGGRSLRRLLAAKGWTVSRFMGWSRINDKHLQRYRRGQQEPSPEHVARLQTVLGVSEGEAFDLLRAPAPVARGAFKLPLYELALKYGFKPAAAARAIGMHKANFAVYASGQRGARPETVQKIAAGIGCTLQEAQDAITAAVNARAVAKLLPLERADSCPVPERPPLLGDKDPEFAPAQQQLRKVMRIAADRSIRGIKNAACYERLRVVAQAGDQFNAWLEPEEQDFLFKLNALLERFAETRLREAA